jgi:hypothetical protein
MLALAYPIERRLPAALDEISQVVVGEMNALFDAGVFSVPSVAADAPARKNRDPRRKGAAATKGRPRAAARI